jgi:glycine cleavage system H protein
MNTEKSAKRDLYYTKDHEWIDFQGTVAYTGVCHFKLLGFKEVHQIKFKKTTGFIKKGEIIAIIKYNDYQIEAHMPVDGKIIEANEALQTGNCNLLLQQAENGGWIALIVPSLPYERKELLSPKQYQMNGKGKYAK